MRQDGMTLQGLAGELGRSLKKMKNGHTDTTVKKEICRYSPLSEWIPDIGYDLIDRYNHFYNHKHIQIKQECAANAAPLRLKLDSLTQSLFLLCPHKLGQSNFAQNLFFISLLVIFQDLNN